jgi:hypothetical protein
MSSITNSQRAAAKVVGFAYLFVMATSVFAEFYVPTQLFRFDSAAETARNIVSHELLFRMGIASNLIGFSVDVVLITALYVVTKPVNQSLALLAVFWRLLETATMIFATLNDFDVLRLLSGAEYLRAFEVERLQSLARLSIAAHGSAYNVGLLLFGFGSTVFCYLWLKSGYIPKALAALGVFSSILVGVSAFTFILYPDLAQVISPTCYAPIFLFEMIMGFWLLLKELRQTKIPAPKDSNRPAGAADA